MRLRLTVSVQDTGHAPSTHELEVEAVSGCTAGELARALSTHLGVAGDDLSSRGRPVPSSSLVGVAPLVDGAALTLDGARTAGEHRPAPRSPVQLSVAHGPDAGRTLELQPGTLTIGRSRDADICLDDPGLSRVHAELHVSSDGVQVADLGSTNGTRLDGERLGEGPRTARSGALVTAGASVLRLGPAPDVPATTRPRPDGTTAVNRRPRVLDPAVPTAIALPAPPDAPRRIRVPWVAMLLPIPFAAAMAAFFGPMMLAFAVMGPAVMAGTTLTDRFGARRRYAEESAQHARRLAEALARVDEVAGQEAAELRRAHPDPAAVLATACGPTAGIWERRRHDRDFLRISLGTCDRPSGTRVIRPQGDAGPDHVVLTGVPSVLAWPTVGTAGLCGAREHVLGLARSVIGQVATLHSPADVRLTLLTDEEHATDWEWMARLPHLRGDDGALRDGALAVGRAEATLVVSRLGEPAAAGRRHGGASPGESHHGPWTVLVVDGGADLAEVPGLAEVLAQGAAAGLVALVLAPERGALPAGCAAVLDLARPALPRLELPGTEQQHVVVDRVGAWWADRLSRGLAPLRDATPVAGDAALPEHLSLATALGTDTWDAAALAARWEADPAVTAVPVGAGPDGALVLDLAVDGPHALVGGTTGAGKSEFLRTLVASMAVHSRPDRLSLVLVDYKGGAAFRECADFPQVSGLVTDLDEHLADRALASLSAELKRREQVLHAAGVPDFAAYQRHQASRAQPLARLVVVVDEFRALADELPAFVDGMVRFAALGRSLGVHVVLATQRPAGVVTADIKANVNLRIALRMRDDTESQDVVGTTEAARIPPTCPGRALVSAGGAAPVPFQAAHVGGPAPSPPSNGIRVRDLRLGRPVGPAREPVRATSVATRPTTVHVGSPPGSAGADADGEGPTELEVLVQAARGAAHRLQVPPAPPAWLPPLPDLLQLPPPAVRRQPGTAVVLGVADRPGDQAQEPFTVELSSPGHWAFVGAGGSGRTTALLGLASTATAQLPPRDLHVYAVSGGSLAGVEGLPHCGAHVSWDDLPRLHRLVERLAESMAGRRADLAATRHSSMAAWRAAAPSEVPPDVLLLLDDWDLLQGRTDEVSAGGLSDRLLALLREGDGVGLTAALTGGRSLLVGRTATAAPHRVLLRQADPADALLVGLSPKVLPRHQPPGRGVLPDGTEVQLAVPNPWQPAEGEPGATPRPPIRIAPLPVQVAAAEVTVEDGRVAGAAPTGDACEQPAGSARRLLALGLGGDEGAVVGLDPDRHGRRWLVCGAPRSGVTTALQLVTQRAAAQRRRVAVVGSVLASRAPEGVVVVDPLDPRPLVDLRRAVRDLVVVVDEAHTLVDTPVDPVLREISALVERDHGLLVCGADAGALAAQYRGPAVEVARHRTGLLLGRCGPVESDLLGVRPVAGGPCPPGRGVLVIRGTAVPIQLADPGTP
ncbi:FtsK/SpoIIIE domain-containing protein [Phycicoccus sp. M110.8]|uniref:FtsK/SpoIIIE domain-containing protein n=1 Tax=Phycicoccus sp. M110.8 TaxID=3075433 RepID=UPI0028FDB1B1|nr:FtsK/SpoIIIE domain-containing protein [Phycicoccus sp. M110.8]MDU0312621.1 FtsK/SpoIIIE domain-containing protein [Phycicoccus sp. M110.8]